MHYIELLPKICDLVLFLLSFVFGPKSLMFSMSKDVSSTDFLWLLGVLGNSRPQTVLVDGFKKSVSVTVSRVSLFLERFRWRSFSR